MNRQTCLDTALASVQGAREESYGGPEDSFSLIAKFWNTYLFQRTEPLAAHDVAAMMILFKVARLKNSNGTHEDSWVDVAGYAACGAECRTSATLPKEPTMQYYYRVDTCEADLSSDPKCACWHDEGTGPSPGARSSDKPSAKQWRHKPQ